MYVMYMYICIWYKSHLKSVARKVVSGKTFSVTRWSRKMDHEIDSCRVVQR